MKITTRILLGFIILYIAGFYFVIDLIVNEVRPRYLETVEESMNDTAQLIAALIESESRGQTLALASVDRMFSGAKGKKLSAAIYALQKTEMSLSVYVTDRAGIVVYDSRTPGDRGRDYSRWNDVRRALRGGYGARSSHIPSQGKSTNALYVAAPVRVRETIIGAVTVIKPETSVHVFMDLARRKIIIAGVLTALAFILVTVGLSFWIHRPLRTLVRFVQSLGSGGPAVMPRLGAPEIRDLGAAFMSIRRELEGKKYIEEYVMSLTHELKSPLSSIRGSAELIIDGDMPEEQRKKFYSTIYTETLRIQDIIHKLMQLSMVENRAAPLNDGPVNICAGIDEIMTSLETQRAQKNLQIVNAVDTSLTVPGERFLIHHAIANLIVNAIQFSDANGTVTLSAARDEHTVRIQVADGGEGIPPFAEKRIFDRFYSIPPQRGHQKGSGLGLPFVREVARLHGGWVRVANNADAGVTATLCLPLRPPS